MAPETIPAGGILRLVDFAEDCKKLDLQAFIEKHGEAFLLHHGPLGKLQVRAPGSSTMNTEGSQTATDVPFNPKEDFLVFPVRRKPNSKDEGAWVGQSESNDVVVPEATVSGVHAFIRRDQDNRFYIQDMNSRNGTRVDDEPVPGLGIGPPKELDVAAEVTLGATRLTFLPAAEFQDMVNRIC